MSTASVSDAERARILEEFERENARPLPRDYSPVAKIGLVLAAVALWNAGALAGWLHTNRYVVIGALVAIVASLLFMTFTNFAESAAASRAEAAAHRLESDFPSLSDDERRRLAVTLIANAFFSGGPYTRETIDLKQLRARLGAAVPYVETVEEVLAAERKAYRVLSTAPSEKGTAWKQD